MGRVYVVQSWKPSAGTNTRQRKLGEERSVYFRLSVGRASSAGVINQPDNSHKNVRNPHIFTLHTHALAQAPSQRLTPHSAALGVENTSGSLGPNAVDVAVFLRRGLYTDSGRHSKGAHCTRGDRLERRDSEARAAEGSRALRSTCGAQCWGRPRRTRPW